MTFNSHGKLKNTYLLWENEGIDGGNLYVKLSRKRLKLTFYYSKGNGKAKLTNCAIGKLQILITNISLHGSTVNN